MSNYRPSVLEPKGFYEFPSSGWYNNGLPPGIIEGVKHKKNNPRNPGDLLETITKPRMLVGKEIDYDQFDIHASYLRSKGYAELVYPFDGLSIGDLVEFTVYGAVRPIFGKDVVQSFDKDFVYVKNDDILKSDIVRLFRKPAKTWTRREKVVAGSAPKTRRATPSKELTVLKTKDQAPKVLAEHSSEPMD